MVGVYLKRPVPGASLLAALIEFTPGSGDEMGGKHMPLSAHAQQAISSLPAGSGSKNSHEYGPCFITKTLVFSALFSVEPEAAARPTCQRFSRTASLHFSTRQDCFASMGSAMLIVSCVSRLEVRIFGVKHGEVCVDRPPGTIPAQAA